MAFSLGVRPWGLSFFYKDTSHIGLGPIPITWCDFNDLFSRYSLILRYWGLRLPHVDFEETNPVYGQWWWLVGVVAVNAQAYLRLWRTSGVFEGVVCCLAPSRARTCKEEGEKKGMRKVVPVFSAWRLPVQELGAPGGGTGVSWEV